MNIPEPAFIPWSKTSLDVGILIVNYRTRSYVVRLLESFQKHENYCGNISFYIGDNASWDDLSDISTLFPGLTISVFQFSQNHGFGTANNLLAKNSNNEPILFMVNPDIEWIEPVIEKLVASFNRPTTAVIGLKLRDINWWVQIWDHGELHGLFAFIANNLGSSYWRDQKMCTNVAWTSGAAFMIRSDVFWEIGGFDEDFFLYQEEVDLCLRIRKYGWNIQYNPEISMQHIWSVVAGKSKYMIRSLELFLAKHHPLSHRLGIILWLNRMYWKVHDNTKNTP